MVRKVGSAQNIGFASSLSITLLTWAFPYYGFAKCRHDPFAKSARYAYFSETPIFLKGRVTSKKIDERPDGRYVSLRIIVQEVLKGGVKASTFSTSFKQFIGFEGTRDYSENESYIFGILRLNGEQAEIQSSRCFPEYSENDLRRLLAWPHKAK